VKSERPELTAVRIVVSGGRAMGSAENFVIVERVAKSTPDGYTLLSFMPAKC
jgi:electron transfer flavoprotein alpha subunit